MAETVRDFRRAQIVAASRAIVAEEGLDALTFAALEKRLSFTRGVVTYHFASKDEIVRAVYASAIAEIDDAVRAEVEAGATFAEKLRAVIGGNVRGFIGSAEAGKILLSFWGRISSDPDVRRLNAELYAKYRRRCAKLLKGAVKSGEAAVADVEAAAALAVGVVLGIATQEYFEPGAIDVDAAIDLAVDTLLAGMARRGGDQKGKRGGEAGRKSSSA